MSEFKINHLMVELLNIFGSKASPEEFIEIIKKYKCDSSVSSLSPVLMQSKIKALANNSSNPELFLEKCKQLQLKNVDNLGAFILLLYQISEDQSLKHFLSKTEKVSKTVKKGASEITTEDLPEIRNRLLKAVKKSTPTVLSEIQNKNQIISLQSFPSITSWALRRPHMSWDFSSVKITSTIGNLGKIPTSSQENILIEDMLNILLGLDGCYIESKQLLDPWAPREFTISESVDISLSELVKQILPLASHYSLLQRFVEEKTCFEYGQVNNAVCAFIQKILKEYCIFICQLESEFRNGSLNLHKLWFYVQEHMHIMGLISGITASISKADARGGKVLTLLHEQMLSSIGDSKAQTLFLSLTQAATVPYMNILEKWIYKGVICDPIKEFLVEDNEVVQREELPVDYSADYWAKRYTIRRERIPKFLERVSDHILRAGKYLNVIRQCGKTISSEPKHLIYSIEESDYVDTIEKAYLFASKTLLDLLMNENDLMGRLKSVKHYFLLDQGDFIVQFMHLTVDELDKDVSEVSLVRLQSLLEIALRNSSASNDPYKDDMRAVLLPYDLQFQMCRILSIQTDEEQEYWAENKRNELSGLESFSFGYEVRWPVSLILNHKTVAIYQMIFRHLFFCKYVERLLCQVWRSNRVAKMYSYSSHSLYRSAYALRQRMLHFVQNLEYHMMVEVIEPNWNAFMTRIAKVTNVDEVLNCHNDFQDMCLKDCMLTSPHLLTTITALMDLCCHYCQFMDLSQQDAVEAELGHFGEENHRHRFEPPSWAKHQYLSECTQKENFQNPENGGTFTENIAKFNNNFIIMMVGLLDQINELGRDSSNDRLFNLLYRLDYAHYTSQMERLAPATESLTSG